MSKRIDINEHIGLIWYTIRKHFKYVVDDPEELFNEGYVILHRASELYNPEKGTFATYARWFLTVRLYEYCKKQYKHSPLPYYENLYYAFPKQSCIDLQEAIKKLDQKDRKMIFKYYIENKDMKDIAKEENITKQGVYWRLKNIRKKLRPLLRGHSTIDYI